MFNAPGVNPLARDPTTQRAIANLMSLIGDVEQRLQVVKANLSQTVPTAFGTPDLGMALFGTGLLPPTYAPATPGLVNNVPWLAQTPGFFPSVAPGIYGPIYGVPPVLGASAFHAPGLVPGALPPLSTSLGTLGVSAPVGFPIPTAPLGNFRL